MSILQTSKKILISVIIQALVLMPVFAIDLDCTVDDAIRKNYKVDEANIGGGVNQGVNQGAKGTSTVKPAPVNTNPLPKLPAPPKTTTQSKPVPQQVSNPSRSAIQRTVQKKNTYIPLRKGTEIDISNINAISDRQRAGKNIVFVSQKPLKTPYYTIPQGTKFVGKIVESHTPQITGNGGLVSLEVVTIILADQYQHIDTRITKVDGKKVFFEDIKGKRSYWKNTVNKGKWGRRTFHKMNKLSANLLQDKTTVILAPFTFIYGTALGCISTAASPVVSIFCKGASVNIPAGTSFRIKLEKDAKVKVNQTV